MANRTIHIDGTDYTAQTSGLEAFKLTYSKDSSSQTVDYALSNTLTFTHDAFDYLENRFFTDKEEGYQAESEVIIFEECCNKQFTFTLTSETLIYCPAICEIRGGLKRKTSETECYDYLQNTIFWKNGYLAQKEIAKVGYCNQSNFMTGVLFFLRLGLYPILIILQAIDFLFDTDVPSLDNFDATVTGCGRFSSVSQVYHPSPYLRNIFEYHCGQCGIEFVSSILQSAPYNNTVLLQAQYQEGCHDCDWIEDNGANLTPIQLLDLLKDVFNADYKIKNGKLFFEWKEFFKDNQSFLEDIDTVYTDGLAEEPPCYEYIEQKGYAFGRFEYANDALDESGNASSGLYNDIVEWNNPPRDIQRGEHSVRLEFSPASFMRDKEQKRIVFHEIDKFREERYTDGLMIMKSGKAANFKLLLIDGGTISQSVQKVKRQATTDAQIFEYNVDFFFDEMRSEQELYKRYHYVENPRHANREYYAIESYEYQPSDFCATVDLIETEGIDLTVPTRFGNGIIDPKKGEIEIDFEKKTVNIKNIII